MRRLLAALVLALMVLPAMVMLIPSTEAQSAVDRSTATVPSFTDANGLTMHVMTEADMLELREKVGTHVDGVNYDVIVGRPPHRARSAFFAKLGEHGGEILLADVPNTLALLRTCRL